MAIDLMLGLACDVQLNSLGLEVELVAKDGFELSGLLCMSVCSILITSDINAPLLSSEVHPARRPT